MGKCHLQDEEYNTDAETDGDATLGIQTQSVTEVQETADDGLRHIVGQTHLAIRYQPTLQGDGACPIQQQEDAHYGKHEKQIVPWIKYGSDATLHERIVYQREKENFVDIIIAVAEQGE